MDLLFILVLMEFLTVEVVLRFLRHFPTCGVPARWRNLRNVVLGTCRFVASEFLIAQLQIQEAAERRGLHGLR